MSLYPFAFLFDHLAFKEKITPALDALINGNSNELEELAINMVRENPNIWEFVGFSRLPLYDHDTKKSVGDVVGAGALPWLILVISNFCSRIDHYVEYGVLRESGVNEVVMDLLYEGRPLSSLLTNIKPQLVPNNFVDISDGDREFNIDSCHAGWLDFEDIEKIKVVIQSNMELRRTSDHDNLVTMLDKAILSKKALILGFWFN